MKTRGRVGDGLAEEVTFGQPGVYAHRGLDGLGKAAPGVDPETREGVACI